MSEEIPPGGDRLYFGPHRFSLKSLLALTLLVALVLAEIVVAPNTQFFKIDPIAIFFVLAPIPLVIAIDRMRLINPRYLALTSLALFGISLFINALAEPSGKVESGIKLFISSFVGLVWCGILIFEELLGARPQGHMAPGSRAGNWPFLMTCMMGAAANVFFLVGAAATLVGPAAPRFAAIAWKAGLAGFILAALLFVSMKFTFESDFYPGYGLWVTSMLALWLGTRRAEIPMST